MKTLTVVEKEDYDAQQAQIDILARAVVYLQQQIDELREELFEDVSCRITPQTGVLSIVGLQAQPVMVPVGTKPVLAMTGTLAVGLRSYSIQPSRGQILAKPGSLFIGRRYTVATRVGELYTGI